MTAVATGLAPPSLAPAARRPPNGGAPARRALTRWAWRLFRREWRQHLFVLGLITVAVAAVVVASTVATTTPQSNSFGFGSATNMGTFQGPDPHLAAQVAALEHRFGQVDVIENESFRIPGSVSSYDLRAQNPHGAFGGPMLQLASGHYPTGPGEVALTANLAATFHLTTGDLFHTDGTARRIVGIVQNPQSLLDEFALVAPGQVANPTSVTILFDAHGRSTAGLGSNFTSVSAAAAASTTFNPETISLAIATIGMLLIALVSIGGFTVLAQRRLRSLGMIGSLGATDRHIRLVVMANGLVVGFVGTVVGAVVGFLLWLAYRSHAEASSHHLIGAFQLPWTVIGISMGLAVVATFFASTRPARAIVRVPIVTALSGRPAEPKQVHRSALPGIIFFLVSFLLLSFSTVRGGAQPQKPELILGLVCLVPGVILLSPFFLALAARAGKRTPVGVRLALRDLARYRARSGSALAAISIGIMIAMIIALVAAIRYGEVLDYAGPNLANNQLQVYTPIGPYQPGPGQSNPTTAQLDSMSATAHGVAHALGATTLELEVSNATLNHTGSQNGRNWNGPIFVGTPQLLRTFGINPSTIDPNADILTMRPGLSGLSDMQLGWNSPSGKQQTITPGQGGGGQPGQGSGQGGPSGNSGSGNGTAGGCIPANDCLANPVIQEVGALPAGTSTANTVITEHAIHEYHLQTYVAGWLLQTAHPLTASQIRGARLTASAAGLSIEAKNDSPSSTQVIDWATVFGVFLALCILAMSIGLIRSETAGDMRTLAATGASGRTRRTITAATAGGLGLLGAVLGTLAAYIGVAGYASSSSLNGGLSGLSSVPVTNLLVVLVGMPIVAAAVGWLLAGRQPHAMAHSAIE